MPLLSAIVFGTILLAPPGKAAPSHAAPAKSNIPAEWQARYNKEIAAVNKLDIAGYISMFDKSFVYKGPDGKTQKFDAYKAMMKTAFASTKQIVASVKLLSVKPSGKDVNVSFQLAANKFTKDGKHFAISEVGTDTWRKIGSDWKCVMTVDKIFSERPAPMMHAHAESRRNH